jgi:hypothetical protein
MNRQHRFVAHSACTLILAWLVAGCGDYSQPKEATGGSSGSAPTGGASGTSQSGTGGASGSGQGGGATGGTGAQAGSGASGTGGASGQAGGGTGGGGAGASGGSGGVQASCDDVAPCGGELAGTWSVASCSLSLTGNVDLTGLGLNNACMSTPITSGSMTVSGTLTFVAGGTFMDNTTTTGEAEFELAPPCLELSGTRTTCEMIARPISSVGFTMLTCVDNATTMGCTCSATMMQSGGLAFISFDPAMSGTYTTANNTVTTSAFGMNVDYSYCVAGSTLTMTPTTVNKTGTVEGPIVLTKQ